MSTKITVVSPQNSWFSLYVKDIEDFCLKNNYIFSLKHNHKDVKDEDIVFYLSYTNIVDKDTLSCNKHNIVVHASDLPKGKGWSPFIWSILNGDNDIVLSLFEANDKVDDGDIYIKRHVLLDGFELIDDIRAKIGSAIVDLCCDFILHKDTYVQNKKAQEGDGTYYRKRTEKDSELFLDKTLDEQFNLLRIVDNDNYPAFFYKDGHKYIIKIYKA